MNDVGLFIKTFCELYRARLGATYHVKRTKDIPLARALLNDYGPERLAELADLLLQVDDSWINSTDRGIGILSVRASWLDLSRARLENGRAAWRLECRREHGGACSCEEVHAIKMRRGAAE